MKFGVVVFPGSSGDRDMIDALEMLGQQVSTVWHKDSDLSMFSSEDWIILPGGSSFGDYLRCGSIASLSPIIESIRKFAAAGGKVLGICNGFQVLCESGLLPGVLLRNANSKFLCGNVYVKSEKDGAVFEVPVAHEDGRYYTDSQSLADIEKNGQVLYRYCSASGETGEDFIPNGSANGISGISNKEGNVIGMMQHPERACDPLLGNTDGRTMLEELFGLRTETVVG